MYIHIYISIYLSLYIYIYTFIYIYISTYTGVRGLGFLGGRGARIRTLRAPGGLGTGVLSTGSSIPAMFETEITDKSRYDRLLNRMIASKSPEASIWTPTWPNLGLTWRHLGPQNKHSA